MATDAGGIPDLVTDGVEGLLVPPADVAALAALLERVLVDRALAERLGAAARARYAEWHSTPEESRGGDARARRSRRRGHGPVSHAPRLRHADARRRASRARADARPRRALAARVEELVVLCASVGRHAELPPNVRVREFGARLAARARRPLHRATGGGAPARGRAPTPCWRTWSRSSSCSLRRSRSRWASGSRSGTRTGKRARRSGWRRGLRTSSSASTGARSRSPRRRCAASATRSTSQRFSPAAARGTRRAAAAARARPDRRWKGYETMLDGARAARRARIDAELELRGPAADRRRARAPSTSSRPRSRPRTSCASASASSRPCRGRDPGAARAADALAQRDPAARERDARQGRLRGGGLRRARPREQHGARGVPRRPAARAALPGARRRQRSPTGCSRSPPPGRSSGPRSGAELRRRVVEATRSNRGRDAVVAAVARQKPE